MGWSSPKFVPNFFDGAFSLIIQHTERPKLIIYLMRVFNFVCVFFFVIEKKKQN